MTRLCEPARRAGIAAGSKIQRVHLEVGIVQFPGLQAQLCDFGRILPAVVPVHPDVPRHFRLGTGNGNIAQQAGGIQPRVEIGEKLPFPLLDAAIIGEFARNCDRHFFPTFPANRTARIGGCRAETASI